MGKIFVDGANNIIRVLDTESLEKQFPGSPQGTALVLEFDEIANKSVFVAIAKDFNAHSIVAGTLHKNGIPVPIALDSNETVDRKAVMALMGKLIGVDLLTQADLKSLFRFLLNKLR